MLYSLTADLVVILHFGFILFALFGGFLVLKWRRLVWVHLPAVIWGSLVELVGWYCPLTPLEQSLRRLAGEGGYNGGFIEYYLVPLIYPVGPGRPCPILDLARLFRACKTLNSRPLTAYSDLSAHAYCPN